MPSRLKTFHVTLEGSGNAVTTNKSSNQVAVAGRNVFKIYAFDVENNNFVEKINLRSGKNLNLNFSSNDVAWNPVKESLLATGATNGAVVIWDLGRSGRSKMDQVFADHRRTVNTVNFHATDENLLASCSQDGTMKLFDLRTGRRESEAGAAATFYSASESVRDLQFSPHAPHSIASVQENGNVQLWDSRRFDRPEIQFTAHNGPVFSIDWHPTERKWLSTAGRDKMIKVWDMESNNRPTLQYCIQTIASVARVRWRPEQKFQIASSSLVVDFSVCVWDIRRPFIPYATFTEHKDITKGFVWINTQSLLSAGKDNTLYHHSFEEAVKPIDSANPIAINISNHGDITLAVRDDLIHRETCKSLVNPSNRDNQSTNVPSTPCSAQLVHRRTSQPPSLSQASSSSSSSKSKRDRSLAHQQSMTNYSAVVSSSLPTTYILSHPTSLLVDSNIGCTTTAVSSTDSVVSPSTGSTSPQLNAAPAASLSVPSALHSSLSSSLFLSHNHSNQTSSRQLSSDPSALPSSTTSSTTPNSTAVTPNSTTATATATSASSIITSISHLAVGRIGSIFKNRSSINNNNTVSSTSSGRGSTWLSSPSSTIDHVTQCTSSVLYFSDLKPLSMEWFVQTAKSYDLTGKSFDEICERNAEVCDRLSRPNVANAWKLVRDKYSNTPRLAFAKKMTPSLPSSFNRSELRSREELEVSQEQTDSDRSQEQSHDTIERERNQQRIMSSQLIASTVIGPLRHVNGNQFIPATPARQSISHFTYSCNEDTVTTVRGVKRTSLPKRMSLQSNPSFPGSGQSDSGDSLVDLYASSYPPKDESFSNREAQRETEKSTNFFFGDGDWPFGLSVQDLLSPLSTYDSVMEASKGFDSSSLESLESLPTEAFIQRHAIPELPNAPLSVMRVLSKGSPEAGSLTPEGTVDAMASPLANMEKELRKIEEILCNPSSGRSAATRRTYIQKNERLIEFILRFFAAEGDVQSCVSLLLVLGERISFNEIDELTQEKWFTAYIDLLSRFQLWSVATQVIRLSKIASINGLNQNSTNVNLCCGVCGKLNHGNGPFTCKNCNTKTCVCAVCQQVVHGLYAWCEGCSHGGHLLHLKTWFDTNTKCPLVGCSHECEYA